MSQKKWVSLKYWYHWPHVNPPLQIKIVFPENLKKREKKFLFSSLSLFFSEFLLICWKKICHVTLFQSMKKIGWTFILPKIANIHFIFWVNKAMVKPIVFLFSLNWILFLLKLRTHFADCWENNKHYSCGL